MGVPKPVICYKLSAPVRAVKLADHPGSSLRDPTQELIDIPADVVIELETRVTPQSGVVNILWNGEAFSVYYDDLRERAQIVTPAVG